METELAHLERQAERLAQLVEAFREKIDACRFVKAAHAFAAAAEHGL